MVFSTNASHVVTCRAHDNKKMRTNTTIVAIKQEFSADVLCRTSHHMHAVRLEYSADKRSHYKYVRDPGHVL